MDGFCHLFVLDIGIESVDVVDVDLAGLVDISGAVLEVLPEFVALGGRTDTQSDKERDEYHYRRDKRDENRGTPFGADFENVGGAGKKFLYFVE